MEKNQRARGEESRPVRTPGDGVSGARDGELGPRGSGRSDAVDTDVSETKHRAVRGVARAVEAVGSHRHRRGATARGTLIARTGPPLLSRARGRTTTDSRGCRRDRHIDDHAMDLASARVRRRVVSPRRRRPRRPAEVPAKIYASRCFPVRMRVGLDAYLAGGAEVLRQGNHELLRGHILHADSVRADARAAPRETTEVLIKCLYATVSGTRRICPVRCCFAIEYFQFE